MKIFKPIRMLLSLLCLVTILSGTSQAALQAVGPTDPTTGFPLWYSDATGMAISQCLDLPAATGNIPYCTLLAGPGFNPALPIVRLPTFSNYPVEDFYWVADAKFATVPGVAGAIFSFRLALEGTFAPAGLQVDGTQITFLIVNLQKMSGLPASSTFNVTHPFGSFSISTDAAGNTLKGTAGQAFRIQDDVVQVPLIFSTLLPAAKTHIGPFLRPSATPGGAALPVIVEPASGFSFLANPLIASPVTGGINGNVVTVTGPGIGGPGVNSVTNNLWNIQAKVFTGPIASPMTIDRTTYSRDALGAGTLDVFATALPTASLSISGTGIVSTTMTTNLPADGKFFTSLPFAALPTGVAIANTLDTPVPIPHPVSLADEVIISKATYNPVTKSITIKAASSDKLLPLPVLTAPQFAAPNTLDATGTLTVALPLNTIPPLNVQVLSSHGGSTTAFLSVVTPPAPPVAVNDAAVTPAGTAVTIPVLANDTPAANIDPLTVAIVATSPNGTTIVSSSGTITFTPAAGFAGTATFTYDVKDTFGQVSNTATVSVVVTAPAAPVAVNDTATTTVGTAVTIPVLANDTAAGVINPATVILTQPLNGTVTVNAAGLVTFTPVGPTTAARTFTYTVKDNFAQISNIATVTVAVTAAAVAPVAVADTATTPAGSTVIINVVANDTATAPATINPATLAVSAATGGSAVANLDGTVSYTGPATPGTYTFTYTVKDNAVIALTSNVATVTVTVTVALPVAPTLLTPSGTTATTTPTYTFNAVPGSTGYSVFLWDAAAAVGSVTAAITPAAAGCPGNIGICSIPQVTPLITGQTYAFFARGENASGVGPWSTFNNFTVGTLPVATTLVSPSGTATTTPTYIFNAVPGATGYSLFLWDSAAGVGTVTAAITPAAAGCPANTGTCSIIQATPLTVGKTYAFYARAVNAAGVAPWSPYNIFVVQ